MRIQSDRFEYYAQALYYFITMQRYNHKEIESKWQKKWKDDAVYATPDDFSKPKCYVLDMFPYPSGDGLHVGHPKGYIGTDIFSRYKKMKGFNVLHPMGWDAFGLPAENYAIKNKIHPKVAVDKNIARYKEQLSIIGFNYDWSREINTTDPRYYKWTQWIFTKLFEKGLAYESFEPINWCPSCKTGLANEDLDGDTCERCGTKVEKKPLRQWVLKITEYADRLLKDLDTLEWPESIKESQRNWIGRSEGALVRFALKNIEDAIEVFTTRVDTIFSGTFVILAPEHPFIQKYKARITNFAEVEKYIDTVSAKNEIDRTAKNNKTGVELKGVQVINPATREELPVWVADFVLGSYGTGAVFADAHDARDFDMAKKYGIPLKVSIKPIDASADEISTIENLLKCYEGEGVLFNSGQFDGMTSAEARPKITAWLAKDKRAEKTVKYKIKDWVFSRQRYWGEPIPIIHCESCGPVAVPEKDLPVTLPEVEYYEPSGTGESPLATIREWVTTKCPTCGGKGTRETNTMPQWAGSSWYYVRYMDPHNDKALVDPKKEKYWAPVDFYVGGTEHATRHLIYSRFWHKFLYDIGVVSTPEPFMRLKNQGLIAGPDGRKMSKRFGNVINPDTIVEQYGADTLRTYEMFLGPFEQGAAWSTESIIGPRRFIERVWKLKEKVGQGQAPSQALEYKLHKAIKKVTEDIESMNFNTCISELMILTNEMEKEDMIPQESYETLLAIFAPFAPHVTDELWSELGKKDSIHTSTWPIYDPNKLREDSVNIIVQVNGKVRGSFRTAPDTADADLQKIAQDMPEIAKWIGDTLPKKVIVVKDKLINIVL
jgi:leucyl-tRNA synthetase